jgi:hypothetical protein
MSHFKNRNMILSSSMGCRAQAILQLGDLVGKATKEDETSAFLVKLQLCPMLGPPFHHHCRRSTRLSECREVEHQLYVTTNPEAKLSSLLK